MKMQWQKFACVICNEIELFCQGESRFLNNHMKLAGGFKWVKEKLC